LRLIRTLYYRPLIGCGRTIGIVPVDQILPVMSRCEWQLSTVPDN
jgi:hypothetical protein